MDKNTYVYCTKCIWLIYSEDGTPTCIHEKECDIWDAEDSRPFSERPFYEAIEGY